MRLPVAIVYLVSLMIFCSAEFRIRGKVRKRNPSRRNRAILSPCPFNETLFDDEWSLMEAIEKSTYIFTGKVLNVKKFRSDDGSHGKRSNLYKVHLRRILKGEVEDMRDLVKEVGNSESLSGGTMVVERMRARESCAPAPRSRLSAIFLSDGEVVDPRRGPKPRLRLLTDPIPLTLYHLDRVNAAVKGKLLIKEIQIFKTAIKPLKYELNILIVSLVH